jgi:phospho-N-acetylmuramoyl-pentapeptide-transferase
MSGRRKIIWLLLIALIAAMVLHLPDPYGLGLHSIYVPFYGQLDMHFWYVPVAVLGIAGMANAVNYTDGLDSLCAMTTAIAFCAYGIIAYRQGQLGVVTLCFIAVGALAGFSLVQRAPRPGVHGRYRIVGSGRGARHGCVS